MQKHNLKVVTNNADTAYPSSVKLKKGLHLKMRGKNWQVVFFYKNEEIRKSTGTGNLEEAKQFAFELEASTKQSVAAGYTVKKKAFIDICNDFVALQFDKYKKKEITLANFEKYKRTIETVFPKYFGNTTIDALNRVTIAQYKDWRSKNFKSDRHEAVGTATLNKEDQVLSAVFKYALERGYIKDIPTWQKTKARTEKRIHFEKPVFFRMMRRMRKYIDEVNNTKDKRARLEMYRAVMILVGTGMRPQELLPMESKDENGNPIKSKGLKGGDIKFDFDKKLGKHFVEINIVTANNKNSKTNGRTIGASGAAYWHLKRQYDLLDSRNAKIERLFTTNFRSTFTRFLERTGFRTNKEGHRYTMYSLRHSWHTWQIEQRPDMNSFQFASIAGNSVATIQKYYNKSKTKTFYKNFI